MSVNIGKLRQRISILAPVRSTDQYGQEKPSYATFLEGVSCSVNPIAGDKRFVGQQVYPSVTHLVTMRFVTGVVPEMVVEYAGRRLQIKAVLDPMERHEKLELMCEERADGVRV